MPRTKGATPSSAKGVTGEPVASYKYSSKRKNIPPAGLEAQGVLHDAPKVRYEYNPHLPPALRSAPDAGQTDQLLDLLRNALLRARGQSAERKLLDEAGQRPLTPAELARLKTIFEAAITPAAAQYLADALRRHEPWLEWSGKREKPWFEVEPVALHIHERISTQAILRVLAREDVQRDLFADPQQSYAQAVQFYQHDVDWSNRMILGDSLQIMASLARREDLAGRVQMIYFDPPYGIKFASNFQPQLGQRDVKDREQDLTREPEMVRAYRDTWTLGIHSYLAYLRDRLAMAKELLADTGSIFVQISDENLHRVRCVMDEVFNAENFVSVVVVAKTSGFGDTTNLASVGDFLLWYAKDKTRAKYRPLFWTKDDKSSFSKDYKGIEKPGDGDRRNMTTDEIENPSEVPDGWKRFSLTATSSQGATTAGSFAIEYQGKDFQLSGDQHWKTSADGFKKLILANRIHARENSLRYIRYLSDFPVVPMTNNWADLRWGFDAGEKRYVVETNPGIIERCLLMTTDPGDLVLDPTCGSGTTAFVAEQWGRRWITCDTSRVALALARQRLLTSRFQAYKLRGLSAEDVQRNPHGTWIAELDEDGKPTGKRVTFQCKTVPHITLKSIARNTSLDPIFAQHEPVLAVRLQDLNAALKTVTSEIRQRLAGKLAEKQKREGKKAITEADRRRWELPKLSDAFPSPLGGERAGVHCR